MNTFSSTLLLLALLGSSLLATASHIVRIETKTGVAEGAGMILGTIDININGGTLHSCQITELDVESIGGFGQGDIDVFTGDDLQECGNYTVPADGISKLVLSHNGIDNWLCEYILVVFDDFTFVQCPDGEFIDNLQRHELECGLPSM